MIKFDKNSLENVREMATRMWVEESRPSGIDPQVYNLYCIIKAFCYLNKIEVDFELNRKNMESIDDIN